MLATWWVQATPGTTYWRATIPARHLPGKAKRLELDDLVADANGEPTLYQQEGNTAIWQYPGNAVRALLMAHQQNQGLRILVEVDDNYMRPAPHLPGFRGSWHSKLDRTSRDAYSHQAHRKIVRWVDGVIVTNDELAARYDGWVDGEIYVCPNSADLDDWAPIERVERPLAIGYAGSDSHRYDLSLIERAMDFASRKENVELYKMGAKTAEWRWPHRNMPWTDSLVNYRRNLQLLDVGLCPLKRGDWHDCKSDVKAIEYTLAGALPIVQGDSPVYRDWQGVVPAASTPKQWERVVKWAIESPDEVRVAWESAYQFVLGNKLIEHHVDKWRDAVASQESHAARRAA